MIATLSRFVHPKLKTKLKRSWPFKYKYNKKATRCETFLLPPEFDANIYRKLYKNIAHYNDASALSHYEKQGKQEGKRTHCLESRIDFVNLIPKDKSVLELGPFFRPLMSGENVFYFDILDKEALALRATSLGFPDEAMNCPDIHFVSSTGDLSSVKEQFDFVLSSHVIEHQPNLIQHLNNVENLLKPDGRYFLMAPDKRYTFDHFIPESNVAQVITAYLDNKKEHSLCSILEQAGLTTHNESQQHWRGHHGEVNFSTISKKIKNKLNEKPTGKFVDVHAWHFTSDSFRKILSILKILSYTKFDIERIYHTLYGSNEFWVVLKKSTQESVQS